MNRPTPETDSVVTGNSDPSPDEYEELAALTRQFERDRDALREKLKGMVLVPREPTEEMLDRGFQAQVDTPDIIDPIRGNGWRATDGIACLRNAYKAMLGDSDD